MDGDQHLNVIFTKNVNFQATDFCWRLPLFGAAPALLIVALACRPEEFGL